MFFQCAAIHRFTTSTTMVDDGASVQHHRVFLSPTTPSGSHLLHLLTSTNWAVVEVQIYHGICSEKYALLSLFSSQVVSNQPRPRKPQIQSELPLWYATY
jgi:hypothetical protein